MHSGSCIHAFFSAKMATALSDTETQQRIPSTINSFSQSYKYSAKIQEEDGLHGEASSCQENNSRKKSWGGITCCVPLCYNDSKRNKTLKFYVIPKDPALRKKWLAMISRKNFLPSASHRVCSAHFEGGKKTYLNNVPTIVPKTVKPTINKPRSTRNSATTPRDPAVMEWRTSNCCAYEIEGISTEQQLESRVEQLTEIQKLTMEFEHKEKQLQEEKSRLQQVINDNKFSIDRFKHNQAQFKFYTEFDSYDLFRSVLDFLEPAASSLIYCDSTANIENKSKPSCLKRGPQRRLTAEEEFFLLLVRLRNAFPIQDLSIRFGISTSHVSRILITWIDFLHAQFRKLPIWASKQTVQQTIPQSFQKLYPNTRVILDCTEIFIEMPTSYRSQSVTFSSYKHHNTAKGLIGIAPSGAITFVSDLYAGRFSDRKITAHSGIYNLLEEGDSIMADRGFELDDDLPKGVTLNIPPFLDGRKQLNLTDEIQTRHIASVRVHVERAIERVKNYKILQTVFKVSMAPDLNKSWITCCYLVNFFPQLVRK